MRTHKKGFEVVRVAEEGFLKEVKLSGDLRMNGHLLEKEEREEDCKPQKSFGEGEHDEYKQLKEG